MWGKYTGHPWIDLTKASNAEILLFCCYLDQAVEQQGDLLVIWVTMTLKWCHCNKVIQIKTSVKEWTLEMAWGFFHSAHNIWLSVQGIIIVSLEKWKHIQCFTFIIIIIIIITITATTIIIIIIIIIMTIIIIVIIIIIIKGSLSRNIKSLTMNIYKTNPYTFQWKHQYKSVQWIQLLSLIHVGIWVNPCW